MPQHWKRAFTVFCLQKFIYWKIKISYYEILYKIYTDTWGPVSQLPTLHGVCSVFKFCSCVRNSRHWEFFLYYFRIVSYLRDLWMWYIKTTYVWLYISIGIVILYLLVYYIQEIKLLILSTSRKHRNILCIRNTKKNKKEQTKASMMTGNTIYIFWYSYFGSLFLFVLFPFIHTYKVESLANDLWWNLFNSLVNQYSVETVTYDMYNAVRFVDFFHQRRTELRRIFKTPTLYDQRKMFFSSILLYL